MGPTGLISTPGAAGPEFLRRLRRHSLFNRSLLGPQPSSLSPHLGFNSRNFLRPWLPSASRPDGTFLEPMSVLPALHLHTPQARAYPSVALESNHWPNLEGEHRLEQVKQRPGSGVGCPGWGWGGGTCLAGFTWRGGEAGDRGCCSPSPGPFGTVAG